MIARAFWKLRQFSKRVNFWRIHILFWYNVEARTRDAIITSRSTGSVAANRALGVQRESLQIGLFACKHVSYFQSLMDVQPLWQVDVYQQNVFCRGWNEAENRIPNQNLFSFVSMRIKKNSTFLSADQTSIPGVTQVFPVLEWNLIVVLLSKILDRLNGFL